MATTRKFMQALLSFLVILSMMLPLTRTQPAAAQGEDGIRREVNSGSGKVNFIGPEAGQRSVSSRELGFAPSLQAPSPSEAAMQLAERFAPEFGVQNPQRDLTEIKTSKEANGHITVRYQQNYAGIPVIGGELIVNTDENGDLYSMNGEVAQDIALDTQPVISVEAAIGTAKQGMMKWYGGSETDYQATEPALWIFDEQLLRPSSRPVELVWRLELTSAQQPIRELVLINARTGNVSLHFNQVDTGWKDTQAQDPGPTATPTPLPTEQSVSTEEIIPAETPLPTETPLPIEPTQSVEPTEFNQDTTNLLPDNEIQSAFSGTPRYVAPTGSDTSNSCLNPNSPCATIQRAINESVNDDIINVAEGTYYHTSINTDPNVVILNRNVLLSGGWQDNFSRQTGVTIIDGENLNNGVLVTASGNTAIDHFIIQNSTSSDSGAIYHAGTNLLLTNSTLKNNTGGRGAGIFVINNAALTVVNSTISHNTATSGGGIFIESGTVSIEYSTIAYNTATSSGGGVFRNGGTLNVHNSILATNTNSASPDCNMLSSSNYNIIGSTIGCTFTAGANDQVNTDPKISSTLLGPMAVHILASNSPAIDAGDLVSCSANTDHRDERGTVRPQDAGCDIGAMEYSGVGGSISVGSGSNQQTRIGTPYSTNLSAVVKDYSNAPISGVIVTFTAPASGASGTFADAGAEGYITTAVTDSNGIAIASIFTANSTFGTFNVLATASGYDGPAVFQLNNFRVWYVSPTGTDSTSCDSPLSPCLTIQKAVDNASSGNTVYVATGTYSTTGAYNIPVADIAKNVTISGGWNTTFTMRDGFSTIDGQNQRQGVLIHTNNFTDKVTISHFVIKNGETSTYYGTSGGGIQISSSNVFIDNSLITSNYSDRYGGGISARASNIDIENSTITGNTAYFGGGGIYFDKGFRTPTIHINNTTIAYNSATHPHAASDTEYGGGGIYFDDWGSAESNRVIENSILAFNTAFHGPDCKTSNYLPTTSSHNIIYDVSGCALSGGVYSSVDPKITATLVGTPGHYALIGNSPAVDTGNPDTCTSTDQRGVTRPQGDACDMGAFERTTTTNSTSLFGIVSGNNQRILPGSSMTTPLVVYALDSNGDAISGLTVTFTAPGSGASGTFANTESPGTTAQVTTDSNGVAISPTFTANGTVGLYTITAEAAGATPVSFQVTNILWYVSPTGGSACIVSDPHCTTIQAAIDSAVAGDTIWVENGTYLENLTVSKNLTLQGGWNSSFTAQDGQTVVDGQNLGRSIMINRGFTVSMDHFDIRNGKVVNDLGGGGILNSGALTFTHGAIYNNSAHHVSTTDPVSRGGGIYSNGKVLTLTNVTISNNEADTGGGIFVTTGVSTTDLGITTLNNVTITQNFATNLGAVASGGGIESQHNSPINITNSIVAGNAAEEGQDCYAPLISGGNNLIGFGAGCTITPTTGDQIGTQSEPLDVRLGDLADNSSFTRTHALLVGSPAIDAGNPATCATTDQRGVARPQGAACDIGAFEGAETQATTANVRTYSADSTPKWPGRFLCDNTTLPCTDGSDPEANKAHQYAIGTYNMYLSMHGRKGIDHNNMPVISTVHYCRTEECPYDNAMWSGAQILYGEGHANADDIVAHEYTHGVTQYESNLFYFHQSGAINESFSDMWGEYYDQTNGLGNDADNVKWLIGEDSTGTTPGAMRSMKNPPAFGDPDKMTSTLYVKTDIDSGGVHYNSGINNKAVYLMVDGGSFNAKTVIGIGWQKTLTVYYEAQTNLLTSGSDYSDLYYTLQQACLNVTGKAEITANDCLQVKNALDAVQMNKPIAGLNPDTTLCPTGMSTAPSLTLFEDDFENGTDKWDLGNWDLGSGWELDEHNASSGLYDMWGNDTIDYADGRLTMASSVQIPSGSTYLFFKHAFVFDYWRTQYYDGAVLEYSKNGGTTWLDARPLFSAGQNYKGTILRWYSNGVASDNALKGRSGFVGDSHGYVSSRYSLKSLAGQNVMFRWRFATDWDYSYMGWFVDDVKIYRCLGTPAIPTLQAPPSNALLTTYMPTLNWADAIPTPDHYQIQVATDPSFGNIYIALDQDTTLSQLTPTTALDPNQKYYWRVQAFNAIDQSRGWSAVRYFRTAMLRPTLVEPVDGSGLLNKRPTLEWDDTQGATGYNVQFARVSNFSTVLVKGTSKTSAFTPTVDLLPNTLYYWRVQATGPNGPSLWSFNGSFRTGNPPSTPVPVAPASNALLYTTQPKLDWKNSTAPAPTTVDHYQIQVATDLDFEVADLVLEQSPTISELNPPLPSSNQKYYWRVRTYSNTGHYSAWSPVRYFRVSMLQPVLVSPINGTSIPGLKPVFEWDDVTGATSYTIQVSTAPAFGTLLISSGTTLSGYTSPKNLPLGKTLYWRVKANGPNGPTQWTTSTFVIQP